MFELFSVRWLWKLLATPKSLMVCQMASADMLNMGLQEARHDQSLESK
jgi:hypothetical protein